MTGYVNVPSVNVSFYHDGKCIVTKVVSFRYFFFPVKQNCPIYTLIATVLLSIIQILAKQMCEFFFGGTDRWMNSNTFSK